MKKMVRRTEDITGMIDSGLKTGKYKLADDFLRPVFKSGILVKTADKEQTVTHTARCFF